MQAHRQKKRKNIVSSNHSQGSQAAIDISSKNVVCDYANSLHDPVVIHNQGGYYYTSLKLQALDLPPHASGAEGEPLGTRHSCKVRLTRNEMTTDKPTLIQIYKHFVTTFKFQNCLPFHSFCHSILSRETHNNFT